MNFKDVNKTIKCFLCDLHEFECYNCFRLKLHNPWVIHFFLQQFQLSNSQELPKEEFTNTVEMSIALEK